MLDETPCSTMVLCPLGERWWDTTYTLTFWLLGDDYDSHRCAAATGMDCDGDKIEVDHSLWVRPKAVRAALGDVGRIVFGDSICLSLLRDVLLGRVIDVKEELWVRKIARLFILLVLGGFLVVLSGEFVLLWFFPYLRIFRTSLSMIGAA